ncbi:MAG: hypothetical protein M5U09_12550 [Gammaproteobacteria bacterium]|nr:hypothetical protein [Gammaproteobacteria bacterium]
MAGIITRPPRPAPDWDVREWQVGIIMSGRHQAAVLVSAGPEPTTHVYLQRIGAQRSPMAIMPGTSVLICAGAPEAITLARHAGFAASLDPEQIAVWEQQI